MLRSTRRCAVSAANRIVSDPGCTIGVVPWGDPAILRQILRESRFIDPRDRGKFQRAAVQVGIVESGGRNLPGGDADSAGWRQERASLYPNPTNVQASVRRFRREFEQANRPGLKSWQIAAMVQRPAAQYRGRYRDVRREARRVLAGAGARGGREGLPGGAQANLSLPGAPGARNLPMGSEGLTSLLAALGESKPQIPSAGLVSPAFSAGAAMPAGYQAPASGGGPAPKRDITGLLEAVQTLGGDIARAPGGDPLSASIGTGAGVGAGAGGTPAAGRGRARLLPGADRAGVQTKPYVLRFARKISAIAGGKVRIGTGTNHSRLTVNGNVSDHWSGDAGDVPATGRRLIELGQAALIAAGANPKWARKQRGGLYNIGGAQIIFNTQEGGDHTNHLHFNPPRPR